MALLLLYIPSHSHKAHLHTAVWGSVPYMRTGGADTPISEGLALACKLVKGSQLEHVSCLILLHQTQPPNLGRVAMIPSTYFYAHFELSH